jgi:aspartokinase
MVTQRGLAREYRKLGFRIHARDVWKRAQREKWDAARQAGIDEAAKAARARLTDELVTLAKQEVLEQLKALRSARKRLMKKVEQATEPGAEPQRFEDSVESIERRADGKVIRSTVRRRGVPADSPLTGQVLRLQQELIRDVLKLTGAETEAEVEITID